MSSAGYGLEVLMDQEYRTIVDILLDAGQLELASRLSPLAPEEREGVFKTGVSTILNLWSIEVVPPASWHRGNFEAADRNFAQWIGWYWAAIADTVLIPYTHQQRDKLYYQRDFHRSQEACREQIDSTRTTIAGILYLRLGSSPWKEVRKALLRQIASRWASVKDEEAASKLLTFLLESSGSLPVQVVEIHRTLVAEALREFNEKCSHRRMASAVQIAWENLGPHSEIPTVLTTGWVRGLMFRDPGKSILPTLASVTRAFSGEYGLVRGSGAAFRLVTDYARSIAELDVLAESLARTFFESPLWQVAGLDPERKQITLELAAPWTNPEQSAPQILERVRRETELWLKQHPTVRVTLQMRKAGVETFLFRENLWGKDAFTN